MLKCRDVAKESGDYIEHAMPWHRVMQMKLHLLMCRHCRNFVKHMRTAITFFRKLPADKLPDDKAREIAVTVRKRAAEENSD